MARKLKEKIDTYTECSICTEPFTRPKHLQPCLHVFCEECIQSWASHQEEGALFPCPHCKTQIKMPPGGVKQFPDSFLVNNLVDDFGMLSLNGQPCGRHPSESLTLICKSCNVYICIDCTDDHPSHKIVSLKNARKSLTGKVTNAIEIGKSRRSELSNISDRMRSSIFEYKSQYSASTEAVEKVMQMFKQKIEQICEPDLQKLQDNMNKVDESILQLDSLILQAGNLNKAASSTSVSDLQDVYAFLGKFEQVIRIKPDANVTPSIQIKSRPITSRVHEKMKELFDELMSFETNKKQLAIHFDEKSLLDAKEKFVKVHEFDSGMKADCLAVCDCGSIIVSNVNQVKKFSNYGTLIWHSNLSLRSVAVFRNLLYGTPWGIDEGTIYKVSLDDGKILEKECLPFKRVKNIAVDSKGTVHICSVSEKIEVYRKNKNGIYENVLKVQLQYASSIKIDPYDNMYVEDHVGDQVLKFSCRGDFIGNVKGLSVNYIGGFAVDLKDNLYLVDGCSGVVKIKPFNGEKNCECHSLKGIIAEAITFSPRKNQLIIGEDQTITTLQLFG